MTLKPNPKTQEQIGRKLREIRDQKDLSQENVAKAAGISSTYYAGIERGEENPTITVIENICRLFKIKSSEILPF
ncbi:MAG TPA: helix-turn-helix transcriptional regulator [Candidatus Saccharimonadales bacterium]|nr:helix-turn-helix transcriptional regulator [Candidatus Saccharimonadales bacterium]